MGRKLLVALAMEGKFSTEGLQAGDVGTVVHIHGDAAAYEVEFSTLTGHTVAVATILAHQLRPVSGSWP